MWRLLSALVLALMPLSYVGAHHSIDAVYDRAKQTDYRVTITKVEWLNPHAHFWATVRESGKPGEGKPMVWHFELGSPNKLMRGGWSRYTLKQGDQVTVTALPAKNGARQASVLGVTLSGGKHMPNFDLFDK